MLLAHLGDKFDGFRFTHIFGFVLPAGFVFIPAIDWGVERQGLGVALHITNVLGVMTYGLSLVPVLSAQVATFIVFTSFRAFLCVAAALRAWHIAHRARATSFSFS